MSVAFDLQSLSCGHSLPYWMSPVEAVKTESQCSTTETLWHSRWRHSHPKHNRDIDSSSDVYQIVAHNRCRFISEKDAYATLTDNNLLTPIVTNGGIAQTSPLRLHLPAQSQSECDNFIEIHIQFSDRSFVYTQELMTAHARRKKRKLITSDKSEIYFYPSAVESSDNTDDEIQPTTTTTTSTIANDSNNSKNDSQKSDNINSLNGVVNNDASLNNTKQNRNNSKRNRGRNNIYKKLKLRRGRRIKLIKSDDVSQSYGYHLSERWTFEINSDELRFSFFYSKFPQLLMTHHLVHCFNTKPHKNYQSYFSSERNDYQWIQTDLQLIQLIASIDSFRKQVLSEQLSAERKRVAASEAILRRYNRFSGQRNTRSNPKLSKLILFFQIRPRSDTTHIKSSIVDPICTVNFESKLSAQHLLNVHRQLLGPKSTYHRRRALRKFIGLPSSSSEEDNDAIGDGDDIPIIASHSELSDSNSTDNSVEITSVAIAVPPKSQTEIQNDSLMASLPRLFTTTDDNTHNTDDNATANKTKINTRKRSRSEAQLECEIINDDIDCVMEVEISNPVTHDLLSKVIGRVATKPPESWEAGSYTSGLCAVCVKQFSRNNITSEGWICCDFCKRWIHNDCSQLSAAMLRKMEFDKELYQCPICEPRIDIQKLKASHIVA